MVVASSVVSTLFLLPYFEIHGYKFVKSYANDCWTMKIDFEINLRSLSCLSEWAAIEATAKHTISNKKNMVMRPTNTWRWEVSNNKKVKCHRIQKNEVTLSWVSHKLAEGYTKRYMPLSQNLWHWKLSNLQSLNSMAEPITISIKRIANRSKQCLHRNSKVESAPALRPKLMPNNSGLVNKTFHTQNIGNNT